MNSSDKAAELLRLHTDPELLVLVNVWDVASARIVAAQPGCSALATASAAIATCFGYPDGEHIPLDLVLDMTARIVEATDRPVSADLEAGYGDVATTVAAGAIPLQKSPRPDLRVYNNRSSSTHRTTNRRRTSGDVGAAPTRRSGQPGPSTMLRGQTRQPDSGRPTAP